MYGLAFLVIKLLFYNHNFNSEKHLHFLQNRPDIMLKSLLFATYRKLAYFQHDGALPNNSRVVSIYNIFLVGLPTQDPFGGQHVHQT